MFQNAYRQNGLHDAPNSEESLPHQTMKEHVEERQRIANLAKMGVRARRGRRMQVSEIDGILFCFRVVMTPTQFGQGFDDDELDKIGRKNPI